MTTEEKTSILLQFDLFQKLPVSVATDVAERMHHVTLEPRQIFVEEGVDSDKAYFIYEGIASIYRTSIEGEIVNIEFRGAPDIVGKTGLIDNKVSDTSAIALIKTEALVLSQSDFVRLVHTYPAVALQMLRHFSEKTHTYAIFLENLLTHDLHHRTWEMLQYIANYFPNKEIILSQEELADLLWGTRARVTEVLHDLAKEEKILINHRKITVVA